MCDLERARPKRYVSFRSRKKVAVESKKKKMRFSTHAEFTSDFQVASAAMRFFRNASKKSEKVREKGHVRSREGALKKMCRKNWQ